MSKIYIVEELFRGRCGDDVVRTFYVNDEPTKEELGDELFDVVVREGWLVEKSDQDAVISDDDKRQAIISYMSDLHKDDPEKENASDWTKDDKPDANVMSESLGFEVSAALRDEIWALQN